MEKVKLGDFVSIKTGKLDANASDTNGKYPFFTCANEPLKIDNYSYDCECVLVAGNGDLNVKYYNGKFDAYQRTYIIESKDTKNLLNKYLYYLINSKIVKLREDSIGGVIKYIKLSNLTEIKFEPIKAQEQKKLVENLDKVQEIIDIREKQIEQLDELIKSQFVEMFGDPNIVKSNEKTELKTIMISANNGMARRGNDSDGSIVLRLVELQRNYIDYSNVNKIILKDNEKKKYLLAEGDILFARVNGNPDNVGRCAYYKDIGEDVYHNDHIIRVKFDLHKINPIYLCTLLNDEYGRKEFKNKIKTSAGQYTISQDGVERVKIPLPPIELQNKFAEFVKKFDKQKFEIQNSLEEMEKLQESLMNKYFS